MGEVCHTVEQHAASVQGCLGESRDNSTGLWYDPDTAQILCLRKKVMHQGGAPTVTKGSLEVNGH